MNLQQWEILLKLVSGESLKERPVGFIIDSPWLPGWYKVSVLDYYTNAEIWYAANKKVTGDFPGVLFIPGYWSEFGMCSEPSAFGCKLVWGDNSFPHPGKVPGIEQGMALKKPDVRADGLLPFIIKRLVHNEERIKVSGHRIKFAISRGPLNIASFLSGATEFMVSMAMAPEETEKNLVTITDFIVDWISLQMETFRDIDAILILDDIIGFLGEPDFRSFALPHLKRIFSSFPVAVKAFHNDAHGMVCAPYLNELGINLFNFSFEHSLKEMKELTGNRVTLMGNIPPRDVLANGTPETIRKKVKEEIAALDDHSRILWSCGGGMPPDVSSENIQAFIDAVKGN